MGMWDLAPWDNDEAADWFGDVMDQTQLRAAWLAGINADPMKSPSIVRAAAALFVMLGRVYVWPIKDFEDDLEKTITALSSVAKCAEFKEAPELIEQINAEIGELISRRKNSGSTPQSASIASKPWWKFWQ